jgi:hypothetical protein
LVGRSLEGEELSAYTVNNCPGGELRSVITDEDTSSQWLRAHSLATTTVLCLALGEHFFTEGAFNGHDVGPRRGVVGKCGGTIS